VQIQKTRGQSSGLSDRLDACSSAVSTGPGTSARLLGDFR